MEREHGGVGLEPEKSILAPPIKPHISLSCTFAISPLTPALLGLQSLSLSFAKGLLIIDYTVLRQRTISSLPPTSVWHFLLQFTLENKQHSYTMKMVGFFFLTKPEPSDQIFRKHIPHNVSSHQCSACPVHKVMCCTPWQ